MASTTKSLFFLGTILLLFVGIFAHEGHSHDDYEESDGICDFFIVIYLKMYHLLHVEAQLNSDTNKPIFDCTHTTLIMEVEVDNRVLQDTQMLTIQTHFGL